MSAPTIARIHRFRNAVALHVGTGETVYLSAEQALQFGQALRDCADDCREVKFTDSTFELVAVLALPEGEDPR